MKKNNIIILLVLGGLSTVIGLGFLVTSLTFLAKYDYSTQRMGRDAFGFYSGFQMIGIIFTLAGLIMLYSARKIFR